MLVKYEIMVMEPQSETAFCVLKRWQTSVVDCELLVDLVDSLKPGSAIQIQREEEKSNND